MIPGIIADNPIHAKDVKTENGKSAAADKNGNLYLHDTLVGAIHIPLALKDGDEAITLPKGSDGSMLDAKTDTFKGPDVISSLTDKDGNTPHDDEKIGGKTDPFIAFISITETPDEDGAKPGHTTKHGSVIFTNS